jgi:hypothetical protein
MEAVFTFMVHARGVMPFLHKPSLEILFNILTIVSQAAQDAAETLLRKGQLSAQTRSELMGVLSVLTVALERFELADTLCRDLKLMAKVVKDQAAPAKHSPHAYVYTMLATVNELTGWIVAGDRRWCEALVGVLEAVANELCFLPVTPMVKQTVLCLHTNLKRIQPLPKTLTDSMHKVKRRVYRKRIRIQSAA